MNRHQAGNTIITATTATNLDELKIAAWLKIIIIIIKWRENTERERMKDKNTNNKKTWRPQFELIECWFSNCVISKPQQYAAEYRAEYGMYAAYVRCQRHNKRFVLIMQIHFKWLIDKIIELAHSTQTYASTQRLTYQSKWRVYRHTYKCLLLIVLLLSRLL